MSFGVMGGDFQPGHVNLNEYDRLWDELQEAGDSLDLSI
jgi:hypothetical protein